MVFYAISVWQPIASIVTITPFQLSTSISSSFGIAMISWFFSSFFPFKTICPRLMVLAVAQTLTMWIADLLPTASFTRVLNAVALKDSRHQT